MASLHSFAVTGPPGFGEHGAHCGAVLLQSGGECLDCADATRTRLGQPTVQLGRGFGRDAAPLPALDAAGAHERGEPACQPRHDPCLLVLFDPGHPGSVGRLQGRDGLDQQPCELPRPGRGVSFLPAMAACRSPGSSVCGRPTLAGTVRRSPSQRWRGRDRIGRKIRVKNGK